MAFNLGKTSYLQIDSNTVGYITSWNMPNTRDTIRGRVINDDDELVFGTTPRSVKVEIEGYYDLSDTGQNGLFNLMASGTGCSTFRAYEDATNYWGCDLTNDTDATVYCTAFNPSIKAGDVATFSATIECHHGFVRNPS